MAIAGELVTESLDYDGGREVTMYVPPEPPEAMVFAGDGQLISGCDPERFGAHERFFVGDVRRWVRTRFGVALPAGRTAVFGVSASGELALALGLRHPDVYGAIFCASRLGGRTRCATQAWMLS
jgi:pimeloyl-ACP methyl ester carboxylesterase